MRVLSLDSKLWQQLDTTQITRDDIETIVSSAAKEAGELLPSDFEFLNLVVSPTKPEWVIPETGSSGMTYSDEYISLTFDPTLPYGIDTFRKYLREMVFHEMTHATTFSHDPWQPSGMFGPVTEGLAVVFERDYAGAQPLWGRYTDDATMHDWYEEMKALPESEHKDMRYFFDHPDGRRWIAYKTGTWMVDKLLDTGEDLFELMKLPHGEIVSRFEAI